MVRALREHRPLPDLSPPAWLDPPDRAAYGVRKVARGRWTEVRLDKPATAEEWLEWEHESREQLVVSLGTERVGTLAPEVTAAYRAVMTAAAERDELPLVPARLTPRPERGGYLVEVQLPD